MASRGLPRKWTHRILVAKARPEYLNAMIIPTYPEFAPLELDARDSLYPGLNLLSDGISEFTFAGLYLFRHAYGYQISQLPGGSLVISGRQKEKTFFYLPCCFPSLEQFDELMQRFDYMRHFSESQARQYRIELEARGYLVYEDRDSFDYLYNREDLATLNGRAYHKQRNLANGFVSTYACEQRPLNNSRVRDAIAVLDEWRSTKGVEGDYAAALDALEHFDVLGLRGAVYYIEQQPVGWCLGEPLAKGKAFAVHFEKACDRFKGIYQFVNQAFAQSLPKHYQFINREQDLGDLGLRQAKMTYRPVGFVKKYRVVHPDSVDFTPAPPEPPAECGPGTIHECSDD